MIAAPPPRAPSVPLPRPELPEPSRTEWVVGASLVGVALVLVEAARLFASYRLAGVALSARDALATAALQWAPWAALAPLAALLWRAVKRRCGSLALAVGVHALAAPAFGAAHAAGFAGLTTLVRGDAWPRALRSAMLIELTASTLTYVAGALVAAVCAARASAQASELRRHELAHQRDAARLEALRARLEPHFLFNALNGIAGAVHTSPALAEDLLVRLGALLRSALAPAGAEGELAPLADERALVLHYLALEKHRLGARLTAEVDIPDALGDMRLPRLVLQPLVENAVVHGVSRRAAGGAIRVRARRFDDAHAPRLRIEVESDGPDAGAAAPRVSGTGQGLSSTRERLALLYGANATLVARQGAGGQWRVAMEVPCER